MSGVELIAELTDICIRQAEIIKAQQYVIEQFGEQVREEQALAERNCQRQFEIVRKRRRNFVVFRRGGNKTKRFLAQKECSRFAVSGA